MTVAASKNKWRLNYKSKGLYHCSVLISALMLGIFRISAESLKWDFDLGPKLHKNLLPDSSVSLGIMETQLTYSSNPIIR